MQRHILSGLAGLAILVGAQTAGAEAPPPFPEFTFKRVKPPSAGGPRITVRIEPDQPAPAAPTAPAKAAPGTVPASAYTWFWSGISPKLSASGPGRLEQALTTLATGPAVGAPRLQAVQSIASAYGIEILKASVGTRVSPALVLAVMAVESGGRPDAVSTAGAAGLMQLMPATAESFGVADRLDPAQSIAGGVAFLDRLMRVYDGDPILVLAGYNAGETAVAEHDGVPPFEETRDYVPKVLAAFQVARGLCLTPPQLISDGCVFNVMEVSSGG